jgi:predicted membrane-bound dolichyl-phosphate-mannose-protein mannosyltransferase
VHYVPAARQMLEPVLPGPLLNPMHPPLAKELMAVSIRVFGDVPLGWRYPSVLSVRSRLSRCIGVASRCSPRKALRSHLR